MKKYYFSFIIIFLYTILSYPLFFLTLRAHLLKGSVQDFSVPLVEFLIRFQEVVPGLLAAFFLVWGFYRAKITLKYFYEKMLLALVLLSAISLLVGLLNSNNSFYVLGDTYKLFSVSLIYFAGIVLCFSSFPLEKAIKGVFYLFLGFAVFEFLVQVFDLIIFQRVIVLSFYNFLFALIFLFLLPKKNVKIWLLVVLLALSAILTLKRSNWITVLLIPWLAFFAEPKLRLKLRVVKNAIWLSLLVGLVFLIAFTVSQDYFASVQGSLSQRYEQTKAIDSSTKTRLDEAMVAVNQLRAEGNIFNWLLGFGNGAEWKIKYYPSSGRVGGVGSEKGQVHHLHNTWAVFLFRTGLVGVVLFSLFYLSLLVKLYKNIKSGLFQPPYDFYLKVIFVCLAVLFILTFTGLSFWGDVRLAIMVLLAGYVCRLAPRRT